MHVTTSPSLVIRFPIDPMSEALVEVNQAIKASAELAAKETAIEKAPVVEEEAKVDLLLSQAFPENFQHLVLSAEVGQGGEEPEHRAFSQTHTR